jgi:PAS domain-containing protein
MAQTNDQMIRFQNSLGLETGLEKGDINPAFPLESNAAASTSDILNQPRGYFKTARVLSIIGIIAYGIIRSVEISIRNSDYRLALGISLFCGATVAVLLVFMAFVKDKAKLAFYVPFIIFAGFTAGSVYLKEFEYFFMIWLGICGIGCIYHNFKKLLSFSITSSVIIFFLFLFNFITDNTTITMAQAMTRWLFAVFTSLFFLISAKFSLETDNRAAGVMDAFSTLMETTPNLMALLDERDGIICLSRRFAEFIPLTDPVSAAGKPLLTLIEDPQFKMMLAEALEGGELFEGTKEITRNGNAHVFRILSKRLQGALPGLFINIADITSEIPASNGLTGKTGEFFEQLPGADYDQEALYSRLLKSYVVHTPQLLEKLREFSLDKQSEYTDVVCDIKGTSYVIGAAGIGKQAELLEQAVKNGDYKEIQAENNALIKQVEEVLMGLKDLLQKLATNGPAESPGIDSGNGGLEKNAEYRHAV